MRVVGWRQVSYEVEKMPREREKDWALEFS